MSYSILAINPGHNGSVAFVVDGKVVFYTEEERLSRQKYDGSPFRAMMQIIINNTIDELVIGGTTNDLPILTWVQEDPYTSLVRKFSPSVKVTRMGHLHHLGHAASAFYASGFQSAAAIVVDGAGSLHTEEINESGNSVSGYETETIYSCSYPHEFNATYKRYSDGKSRYFNNGIQEFDSSVTITKAYEAVSAYLGFGFIEAGKTMGLSPYGSKDESIPSFFEMGKGNKNLLQPLYPAGALIDEDRYPYLKRYFEPSEWHKNFNLVRDVDKNLAWHVQHDTEQMMFSLIQKAIDTTGETNIVISGGFALNVVANYKYLKQFPQCKFWIDPIAHDGGTALGLARYAWYLHSKTTDIEPMQSVCLGLVPDYNHLDILKKQLPNMDVVDVTCADIAKLIAEGNLVALVHGKSEGGPRALGNRSLLADPRRHDGKDIVNRAKNREWFRPFAGSILEEHVHQWFDTAGLNSSPYMMYAMDVIPEQASKIPAVIHVDGTCRVQTVNSDQNPVYYHLINEFYNITNVPLVLNTSLNLAGQPLVDSIFDAIVTLFNSEIDFLYLPDINKLVKKQ